MAEHADESGAVTKARLRLSRLGRNAGENYRSWRAFATQRRRDLRFRVLPLDVWQIANALAVAATLIAATVLIFDSYLVAWYGALPRPTVGFFRFLTDFGKADWILVGSGLYVIAALIADAGMSRSRLGARRAVRTVAAGYVFAAVALSGIVASLTKHIVGRARPRHFDETGIWSSHFLSGDSSWASFPSGHATTAMALATGLGLLFPRLRPALICAGLWIAFSRLATRAHYPSDVLAGCMLGALTAWLMARLLARHRLVFGFDAGGRLVRRRGASGRLQ